MPTDQFASPGHGAGVTHPAASYVLVIDDEALVCEAITDILAYEGVDVLTAPDGRAGLERLQQHRGEIGLVLLDIALPGLSSVETCRELRRLEPQLPIVVTSGYSRQEAATRFAGLGPSGFVQKPFAATTLVDIVRHYLA